MKVILEVKDYDSLFGMLSGGCPSQIGLIEHCDQSCNKCWETALTEASLMTVLEEDDAPAAKLERVKKLYKELHTLKWIVGEDQGWTLGVSAVREELGKILEEEGK